MDRREEFKLQIFKLFELFQIKSQEEKQECFHLLNQKNIKDCVDYVRKPKRNQFQKKIQELYQKYDKKIQKQYHITFEIDGILKELKINKGSEELREKLLDNYNLRLDRYKITMKIKKKEKVIHSLDEIFQNQQREILLILLKKESLQYFFETKAYVIWADPSVQEETLKSLIYQDLKKRQFLKNQMISLSFFDFRKENQIKFQTLEQFMKKYQEKPIIEVEALIKVLIRFEKQQKIYQLKKKNTLGDLRLKIQKDFIPRNQQQLYSQLFNFADHRDEINLQKLLFMKQLGQGKADIQLTLKSNFSILFYGFHSNLSLTLQQFLEQNTQTMEKQLIKQIKDIQINFNLKNKQKDFQMAFLKYFFAFFWKFQSLSDIFEKTKKLIKKTKLSEIWAFDDPKFQKIGPHFLLMYLLRNSEVKLKLEIMRKVKNYLPLPLLIKQFSDINSHTEEQNVLLNQQFIKLQITGLIISSIGLHNSNNEKGKSQLMNNIFDTNFCLHENKHKIVQNIPYSSFKYVEFLDKNNQTSILPMNFIDVQYGCPEKIQKQIINSSDIVIIHTWKSQEETEAFIKKIQKNKIFIIFKRDSKTKIQLFNKSIEKINLKKSSFLEIPNLSNITLEKEIITKLKLKIKDIIFENKMNLQYTRKIELLQVLKSKNKVNQLKEKISQNQLKLIEKIKKKNIIMIIGCTGAGKSTLFKAILDHKLVGVKQLNSYKIICTQQSISKIAGSSINSQTSQLILKYFDKKNIIIDCPGFFDTRGYETDILNCSYIKTAFQYSKKRKVVLTLSRMDFQEKKYVKLRIIIKNLSNCFKSVDTNSFIICVTHTDKKWTAQLVKNVIKSFYGQLPESISENQRGFYKFIIEKCNIYMINSPQTQGPFFIPDQLKKSIVNQSERGSCLFSPKGFNFLSENTKYQIQKFIIQIKEEIQIYLQQNNRQEIVLQGIINKLQAINNGDLNADQVLQQLGIGTLIGGGVSITVAGVTYVIATGLARYGATLVATAVAQSVLAGTALISGATQAIAFLSGPIGWLVGAGILGISVTWKYFSTRRERMLSSQAKIRQIKRMVQNSINANNNIIKQLEKLTQFCKELID